MFPQKCGLVLQQRYENLVSRVVEHLGECVNGGDSGELVARVGRRLGQQPHRPGPAITGSGDGEIISAPNTLKNAGDSALLVKGGMSGHGHLLPRKFPRIDRNRLDLPRVKTIYLARLAKPSAVIIARIKLLRLGARDDVYDK